jgi:hypothetical protein
LAGGHNRRLVTVVDGCDCNQEVFVAGIGFFLSSRRRSLSADPACCLDIFRCGFWLALHQHETQSANVEADRNHVGCERYVDPLCWIRTWFCQGFLCCGDLVGILARSQLQHVTQAPVRERLVGRAILRRSAPKLASRVRTSSSTIRRAPPSSRSALK